MMMRSLLLVGLGLLTGLVLAAAIGFIAIEVLLPWEDICAVVGPAQKVVETGSALLADLDAWLARAESFLSTSPPEEATEARKGLGGLVDKAAEVAAGAAGVAVDVMTAPLEALIDLAQLLLGAVQAEVDAARDLLASIDQSRC